MSKDVFDNVGVRIKVGDKIYSENVEKGQSNYYIVTSLGACDPDHPYHSVYCTSTDPEDIVTHVFDPDTVYVTNDADIVYHENTMSAM